MNDIESLVRHHAVHLAEHPECKGTDVRWVHCGGERPLLLLKVSYTSEVGFDEAMRTTAAMHEVTRDVRARSGWDVSQQCRWDFTEDPTIVEARVLWVAPQ